MIRKAVALLGVVVLALVLTPGDAQTQQPVKIGFASSLSGPFTSWGVNVRDGMKMAIAELNEKGGVLGRPLELVERDDKNNPQEGITTFRYLVEREGIVAGGGVISSGVGLAVSREAEALKVPYFLTMSGSHAITKKGSRYTFRTCLPAAPTVLEPIAEMIKDRKYTRVGAIFADYEWGHALKASFEKFIVPLPGVKTQMEVAPVPEKDFTPYLRKMQALDPELIVATGHPPGNPIITRQSAELGMKTLVVGSWYPPEFFVSRAGDAVFDRYVDFSCGDIASPAYRKLAEKFHATYKRFFDHNAFSGYVIVRMVADAIRQAKSADPKAVADALRAGKFAYEGYGWTLSYTESGDMKGVQPTLYTFEKGSPPGGINPGANWRPKVLFRSPPSQPYVPTE